MRKILHIVTLFLLPAWIAGCTNNRYNADERYAPQYNPQGLYPANQVLYCSNHFNPITGVINGVIGSVGSILNYTQPLEAVVRMPEQVTKAGTYHVCSQETLYDVPVGTQVVWPSDRNQSYYITPVQEYQYRGRHCRDYQVVFDDGGRTQNMYGTSCMQPDGSWQVMD